MKERLQKIGMTEIHNILQLDSLCEIIKEYYIIIKDISIQKFQYVKEKVMNTNHVRQQM